MVVAPNRPSNAGKSWGIHWFRRDLRIAGNAALRANWKRHDGRVLGLFCFDSKFLSRADFSHNRFAFFLKALQELRHEMRAQGGDLLVVDELPRQAIPKLLAFFDQHLQGRPSTVSFGRDYEPFARARDHEMQTYIRDAGLECITERDHLLFEPHEIVKAEGEPYQVYSAYGRKWFDKLAGAEGQKRVDAQARSRDYFDRAERNAWDRIFNLTWTEFLKHADFPYQDALDRFASQNSRHVSVPIPAAGFRNAYRRVLDFASDLATYKERRDFPALDGTSKLSLYFKNGSLVATQVLQALDLTHEPWAATGGRNQFLKEIAWREFYYSILFHRPEVESAAFLPQFRDLKWQNNREWFERWKEGTTGFPIVDAGMRELRQTGWMHNRVRMIVASFLTKDLLIDWRWGENWFMQQLLDGDLAPNNGGWQWAASTGCDAQPYFRIFNPWLQSAKFDPNGDYIKRFVPELKDAKPTELHSPQADRDRYKYPTPMVQHEIQRDKALKIYKK